MLADTLNETCTWMDAGNKRVHACTCGRMFVYVRVCLCVCVNMLCGCAVYAIASVGTFGSLGVDDDAHTLYTTHSTHVHKPICDLTRRYARMNPRMGSSLDGCFNGWTQRWMVDRPVDYDGTIFKLTSLRCCGKKNSRRYKPTSLWNPALKHLGAPLPQPDSWSRGLISQTVLVKKQGN